MRCIHQKSCAPFSTRLYTVGKADWRDAVNKTYPSIWMHVSLCIKNPKSKVHSTAKAGILLGCDDNGMQTVDHLAENRTVNSVHATFYGTSFPGLETTDSSSSGEELKWVEKSDESDNQSRHSDIFPTDYENNKDHFNNRETDDQA